MAKILSLFILFALLVFTSCCPTIAKNSDAEEIQALIDNQDTVILDAGRTYYIDETLIVDSHTLLIGNGATLVLQGDAWGFYGMPVGWVTIKDTNFKGGGSYAAVISGSFNRIEGCYAENLSFILKNGVHNSIVNSTVAYANDLQGDAAFVLSNSSESSIGNCHVYRINKAGFLVSACRRGATVINCTATETYLQGAYDSNSPNTSWIGNRFYRCSKDGNHQGAITITSGYVLCSGNYAIDCYIGFLVTGNNGLYTSNYIYDCLNDFSEYGNPVGNEYYGNKWE